ncbi:MAG TPA: DUF624 domain-containing protein, partial [Clostridiales bacterium]|nr:DUF624 domain-containing protein [Clostridiales bacterium]
FFPNIFPDAMESPENLLNDTIMKFVLLTVMMCVPMITTGPAQAGLTYILRNYSREEHAFIWGDFKDAAKSNFRQSLIVSTINFFVTFLTLLSIRAYWILIDIGQIPGTLGLIGLAVMFLLLILFACMNIYIYPLMVTFELSLKQLYKNALIFAVIKFLPNIGILLLIAFLVFLSFGLIIPFNPLIGFIPYIFLTLSLNGFITNFYAYPKLKKYIISRLEEEEDDEDEEDDDEEDDEEEDDGGEDDDDDGDDDDGNGSGKKQDVITNTDGGVGVVGEDGITRYF